MSSSVTGGTLDGETAEPKYSVVVPTRGRPAHIRPCVDSILANADLAELVVVDQSPNDETEQVLCDITDSRFRYVHSSSVGVCAARNEGAALTTGYVIAATDDDCRVPPDWIATYRQVWKSNPRAAVICGGVTVPPELLEEGYAVSFAPQLRELEGKLPPATEWGLTANMAMRRSLVDDIGGFDEMLGAGGPLGSGGEPDFLLRALRAGYLVLNAREVDVSHLGIRRFGDETNQLWLRYCAGTSSAIFKHVRLFDPRAAALYVRYVVHIVRGSATNALQSSPTDGLWPTCSVRQRRPCLDALRR